MGFKITYKPLCHVDIWHGYYLHPATQPDNVLDASEQKRVSQDVRARGGYSILDDLSVAPTPSTKQLMAGHKMVFRTNPTGFSLWIQANQNGSETYSPFIPFSAPVQLTFAVEINSRSFWNFTNLDLTGINENVYYFSNRANNEDQGTLYLNDLNDLNDLNALDNYASSEDRRAIRAKTFSLDVSDLSLKEIRFVLGNDTHQAEIVCSVPEEDSFLKVCDLNWETLPSGLYGLTAFDEGDSEITRLRQQVYFNAGDLPRNTFAVIEILFSPEMDFGNFALVRGLDDQELLGPTYTLWWQNRLTRWRYIFDQPQSVSPEPDCDVSYSDAERNQLVTNELQPLVSGHRPIRFCQDNPPSGINEEILLPNPDVGSIYPEEGEMYSEVHLGNFNLSRM